MSSDNSSWNRFARLKVSSKDVNKRLRKIEKGSLRHAHKFVTSRLDRLSNVRRRVSVWDYSSIGDDWRQCGAVAYFA